MRKIMAAETLRQARAANFRIGKLVELGRVALGLGLRRGDDRAEAGQDDHIPRIAALGLDQLLEIGIERARRSFLKMRREYRFGMTRSKLFAGIRRAGLDKDRTTLRATRHIKRAKHRKVRSLVIDCPHTRAIGISPAKTVVE